jgi:hypothetical protein
MMRHRGEERRSDLMPCFRLLLTLWRDRNDEILLLNKKSHLNLSGIFYL